MALVMLDIDHFKRINDEYGHPAGDAVLVQTVQALAGEFRQSDVLSRYGGEEFALMLLDTGGDAARTVVARACERLAKTPFELSMPDQPAFTVQVTLSAGVATLRPGEGREGLVGRADRALYAAKRAGRNRVESGDEAEP
jgi:diguanylate cyclase (GGDEF)-like protein